VKTLSSSALCVAAIALVWSSCAKTGAQIALRSTQVEFAGVKEGAEILSRRDDFVQRLSPFDRAARMKTDKPVSEEEYLKFVGRNVLEWRDAERDKVATAVRGLQSALEALSLPFPEQVWFIKTTGAEEGGAPYTRANAVVLTEKHLNDPMERIQKVLAHEFFHILSRANPKLRDKLYAAIGFVKCPELAFPKELAPRKITNPDAPMNEHCVRVKVNQQDAWVVPILYSDSEKYDLTRGGEFFQHMQFQFLVVTRDETTSQARPVFDGTTAKVVAPLQVSGLYEQTGRNSGRIYHPEEILADNFALLLMRDQKVKSPEVIERMKAILEGRSKPPG
jgi:hypothetical protein